MTSLVAALREHADRVRTLNIILSKKLSQAADEIERLRGAVTAIKQATIDGKVCDDIAWFDSITTLHDFCEQTLNPSI